MPYCTNCGGTNAEDTQFCKTCGSVLNTLAPSVTPEVRRSTATAAGNRAILSMILGLLSIAASCGPFTGIAAILLANKELRAIREGQAPLSGKTLCQIGLWTGWIGSVLCTIAWIAYATFFIFLAGILSGQ